MENQMRDKAEEQLKEITQKILDDYRQGRDPQPEQTGT